MTHWQHVTSQNSMWNLRLGCKTPHLLFTIHLSADSEQCLTLSVLGFPHQGLEWGWGRGVSSWLRLLVSHAHISTSSSSNTLHQTSCCPCITGRTCCHCLELGHGPVRGTLLSQRSLQPCTIPAKHTIFQCKRSYAPQRDVMYEPNHLDGPDQMKL